MKIACILGPYSLGVGSAHYRPLNLFVNNFWIADRGLSGTDLGSGITALKLSQLGHDVSFFTYHVPGTKLEKWENVKLYNYEDRIIINDTFDAIVSWNEPDVFRGLSTKSVRICQQMLNDFPYCQEGFDDFVDVWTSPSDMHKSWMLPQIPKPEKWQTLALGSQPEWFVRQEKVKGSVIWLSSPDRGLHLLLQEWAKIKKAVPEATLKIFYHINDHPNDGSESYRRITYIKYAMAKLKDHGVEYIGAVSRNRISEELSKAMVMVAPLSTIRPSEGFSCSSMEACQAGCVPIIGDIDCLGSIYKDVACMVPSPVEDHCSELVSSVIKGLTDEPWRYEVVSKCQEFAKAYTWDKNVDGLVKLITEHPKYQPVKTHNSIVKKKTNKPTISIVMPTMRVGGLDVVFKSLSQQTFKDFELVLVDGIYKYRKELVAQKSKEYDFVVKHVEPIKNIFPIACLCNSTNTGFIHVSSDLVLMITDYTYLPADCVEKHVNFHNLHPDENMGYMCPHQYKSLPELHSEFPTYKNEETDKYVNDLENDKLNNVMWSIFKSDFDCDPEILPLDGMGNADNKLVRAHGIGDLLAFNGKNESLKLEAILKVNGYDEELDGTTPYQDNVFADVLARKLDFKWICDKENKVYNINPRFVMPHSKRIRTPESNFAIWNKKKTNNFSEPINDWSLRDMKKIFILEKKPYVSIIVTTNRVGGLDILFDGLERQTFKDFELILVDAIYQKRKDIIKNKTVNYSFITKHIEPADNTFPISNYCKSMNTGLCAANGEIVYFTCDYSFLDKNTLLHHANFHKNTPINHAFMSPTNYYGVNESSLSDNFPQIKKYGQGDGVGEESCQLMVTSENKYISLHDKWTTNYFDDLQGDLFKECYWSIFKDKLSFNEVIDINDNTYKSIDNRYDHNVSEVIPEYCSLKNDSFKLQLLLDANGLNEELDGAHGYQDTDLSRRLAKLYQVKFFANNLGMVSIINIRKYLEPRKIINGYNNHIIIKNNEINQLPITNTIVSKMKKMTVKPYLSIIIPTIRIGGFDMLFESLQNQIFSDFEVIIVDGLFKYRKDIVKKQAQRYNVKYKHIESINNMFPSAEYCHANNSGIVHAAGDVILFTTDYHYFMPNYLQKHYNFHQSHFDNIGYAPTIVPKISPPAKTGLLCYNNYVEYLNDLNNGKLQDYMWSSFADNVDLDLSKYDIDINGGYDLKRNIYIGEEVPCNLINLQSESLKTKIVLGANGLNEDLDGHHGWQDTEFAYRIKNLFDFRWLGDNTNPLYRGGSHRIIKNMQFTKSENNNIDICNLYENGSKLTPNTWSLLNYRNEMK